MNFHKNSLLRGSIILVVSGWISKIISISIAIILANKFAVEDYGLAVGYLILVNFTDIFTLGLNSAVINDQGSNRINDKLNLAWTFDNFLPKILVSIIILIFGNDFLYMVTDVRSHPIFYFSLIPLSKAFESNAITILTRQLKFKNRSLLELIRAISYFSSSITFIFFGYGPILVVYSMLISQIVRTISSYFLIKGRPHLYYNKLLFRNMLSFGKWISLANVIKLIKNQVDKIILGYITGVKELAIYNNGAKIPIQLGQDFSKNFSNLLFPIYSQKNDSFNKNVIIINNLSLIFSIIIIIGSYFFGQELIILTFGEEYASSILYLNILVPVIGMKMIYSNVESLLKSKGYSRVDFYCGAFFLSGLLSFVILGFSNVLYFAYLILILEYINVLFVIGFNNYKIKKKVFSNSLFILFNLISLILLFFN